MEIKGVAQNAEGQIRHGTMFSPYQIPLKKKIIQFQKRIRPNSLDLMDFNVCLRFRFESNPSVPMISFKKKNYT